MFGYQYIEVHWAKLESRNTYQGNCNFLHYMLYSDYIYMNSLLGVSSKHSSASNRETNARDLD